MYCLNGYVRHNVSLSRETTPPFILRLLTSCQQKRTYYNYLYVATVAIVLYIAIYAIVLFLNISVFAHDFTFTCIRLSVATIYGARVSAKYNSN